VCEYLALTLQSKFPNMNRVQIEAFVIKLFNSLSDWRTFKDTLRDLLISMKSFASKNDEFYAEEKQVSCPVSANASFRLRSTNRKRGSSSAKRRFRG